ncbi:MAG: cytochrome c oxidase subunit 3 [Proteobacteria bacterium]|nr:cytochrome c oxidase subunit 3 [Pseudomonadota bacterium]
MSDPSKDTSVYYVPENGWHPIWVAVGVFLLVSGIGSWLNDLQAGVEPSRLILIIGGLILIATLWFWFARVIEENSAGLVNGQLKRSYVWGMSWFIFSEVMFFLAFFGALFYTRVLAVQWLGGEGEKAITGDYLWPDFVPSWPVVQNPDPLVFNNPGESMQAPAITEIGAWSAYLPLWNTIILLTSSFTVHFAHTAIKNRDRTKLNLWLAGTVVLGVVFLILQVEEYVHAYNELGLTLDSGIYGSTFFLLTGFHGFHVCLGTFILAVQLGRALKGHFEPHDCFGFEAASWYWHFVDVVWVCLFVFVYVV